MAVKIRLKRLGQKKAPFYRIVVADLQEMERTSLRLVLMIQIRNLALLR